MKEQEASFRGMVAEEDHRKPVRGNAHERWTLKKHKKKTIGNLIFEKKPACSKLCDELIILKTQKNWYVMGFGERLLLPLFGGDHAVRAGLGPG